MEGLKIRYLENPGVLALGGEVDMASGEELLVRLRDQPVEDCLILDLSGVAFIDVSGLRAILRAADARKNGAPVVLRDPSQTVSRLLRLVLPRGAPGIRIEWTSIDGSGHVAR